MFNFYLSLLTDVLRGIILQFKAFSIQMEALKSTNSTVGQTYYVRYLKLSMCVMPEHGLENDML